MDVLFQDYYYCFGSDSIRGSGAVFTYSAGGFFVSYLGPRLAFAEQKNKGRNLSYIERNKSVESTVSFHQKKAQ